MALPSWLSPTRMEARRLRARMKRHRMREWKVVVRNGTLHGWIGEGPPERPLVLLQGFGGSALWQWHQQVRKFARHFQLFLPNLFFFGDSRSPLAGRSLAFQAEAVVQMMDRFGVEKFDLGGLSYGGLVAFQLAHDFPDRVGKLVITASPGPVMVREDFDALLDRFGVETVDELFLPDDPAGVRRLIEVAWHKPMWTPRFALKDAHHQLFTQHVQEKSQLLEHLLEIMDDPELAQRTIPHETLLMWGNHDPIFPVELGQRLKDKLGDQARLHIVQDTAHCPNIERHREWNQVVLPFLMT